MNNPHRNARTTVHSREPIVIRRAAGRPVGQIDAGTIRSTFATHEAWRDWTYLMCGPPGMLDSAEAALMSFDVPAGRIHSERFVYD